jgi:hypothetical protein
MSTWKNALAVAVLALALPLAACGSNNAAPIDAPPTPDAPPVTPDAPVATFADFVKDLIVNQTSDTTPAVAVDFASADSDDPSIFSSLFGSD